MEFKDIVVATEYQTKTGEAKKKYQNIGTLFVYDDGGMGIKLDSIPLNWDGKASVYEKKGDQQQPQQQRDMQRPQQDHRAYQEPKQYNQAPQQGYGQQMPQQTLPIDDDQNIPF